MVIASLAPVVCGRSGERQAAVVGPRDCQPLGIVTDERGSICSDSLGEIYDL